MLEKEGGTMVFEGLSGNFGHFQERVHFLVDTLEHACFFQVEQCLFQVFVHGQPYPAVAD